MMKFDNLTEEVCLVQTADDPLDCPTKPVPSVPEDPVDGNGNGGVDPTYSLLLKPAYAMRQVGEPVQYSTWLKNDSTGEEQEVTMGVVYGSGNPTVALIGAITGRAFCAQAGITTISSTWQDLIAFAQLEVVGDCDSIVVGMMLLVDNSKSMNQVFTEIPVPPGQPAYATRIAAAKSLAARFAEEVNGDKDYVGLTVFNEAPLPPNNLTHDKVSIRQAAETIPISFNSTSIGLAIADAVSRLEVAKAAGTIDLKVIVLFSDGENKIGDDGSTAAETFKSNGGIIVTVGLRAHGDGFQLLKEITSEGLFLNALATNVYECGDWLSGFKGYFCAGSCEPAGGVTVYKGQLNYCSFTNWDVGCGDPGTKPVDLIGGDYPYEIYNFLPGNGLYVDLCGSSAGWSLGLMRTKVGYPLVAGRTYELRYKLAGNQRQERTGDQVKVRVESTDSIVDATVTINDYTQDFTQYINSFVATITESAKISFEQIAIGVTPSGPPAWDVVGNLLDEVELYDVSGATQLFYDDFDTENPTYITPGCDAPGYDYCPGYGCIDDPVSQQIPDADPLTDNE